MGASVTSLIKDPRWIAVAENGTVYISAKGLIRSRNVGRGEDDRESGSRTDLILRLGPNCDFDGPAADGTSYAKKFSGKYSHRILNGIGHNVPQEAPEAFAKAVVEVDGY